MIESTNFVFPLFPGIEVYMKSKYSNKNIFYLGNVINTIYKASKEEAIRTKMNSNDLLFVGDSKYIEGAQLLLKAFTILKHQFPELTIHLIGLNEDDLADLPQGARCYGYLDKGDAREREIYYSLFHRAKIFINTTDKWGAFSATIEAMYFYTPVIVSPYDEFVKTFGKKIHFGRFCRSRNPEMLKRKIQEILNDPSYMSMCIEAHNSVKSFTWSAYVERLLEKIST